jgi:hypothetical protein
MADQGVLLANYQNPVEAELARNRLEADGIPAVLVDTSTAGVFSGMGIAVVKLYVRETDVKRARAILASPGEDPVMRRMNADVPLPMESGPAWIYCSKCGSEVSTEFERCSCGAVVPGSEEITFERNEEESKADDMSSEHEVP